MDVQVLISTVAAAGAVASWWAVKQQVDVMRDQTKLQRDIAHEAAQPYVYVDLEGANPAGTACDPAAT